MKRLPSVPIRRGGPPDLFGFTDATSNDGFSAGAWATSRRTNMKIVNALRRYFGAATNLVFTWFLDVVDECYINQQLLLF
jgi:hypothetical protein